MFEVDPAKSDANRIEHGLDFVEAQALWSDEDLTALGMVEYDGETRHLSSERSAGDAGPRSSPSAQSPSDSSPSVVRDRAKKWPTTAAEFDQMFDDGEDIDHLIDWAKAKRAQPPKQ